jgi:hypothetical protein
MKLFNKYINYMEDSGMKKYLIACFILLLLGSPVFCQEVKIGSGSLTFNGGFYSGLSWKSDDVDLRKADGSAIAQNSAWSGSDGRVGLYSNGNNAFNLIDNNVNPMRIDVGVTYQNGPASFRFVMRANNAQQATTATFSPQTGYAWINLYDNVFRVVAGYIADDNPWNTGGPEEFSVDDTGLRLEIAPFNIPALKSFAESRNLGTLNAGIWVSVPIGANGNPVLDSSLNPVPDGGAVTVKNVLRETYVGFSWALPVARFSFMYHLDGFVDDATIPNAAGDAVWSSANEDDALYFGAQLYAVPNLTLSIDGLWKGLGNWKARGRPEFRQVVEYSLAGLNVNQINKFLIGIYSVEKLWGFDMKEYAGWDLSLKPWIKIQPYIGYNLTETIQLRVAGGVSFGHLFASDLPTMGSPTQHILYEDLNVFVIPAVFINFGNGLSIKAWYAFNKIRYGDLGSDPAFADRAGSEIPRQKDGVTPVESVTKHQVALTFSMEF